MTALKGAVLGYNARGARQEDHPHPKTFVQVLLKMIEDPKQTFDLICKWICDLQILVQLMYLLPIFMSRNNVDDLSETEEETGEDILKTNQETIKYQRQFLMDLMEVIRKMMRNEEAGKQLIELLMRGSFIKEIFLEDNHQDGGYKDEVNRDIVAMGLFFALCSFLEEYPNIEHTYLDDSILLLEQLYVKIKNPKFGEEGAIKYVGHLIESSTSKAHKMILYKINTEICQMYNNQANDNESLDDDNEG